MNKSITIRERFRLIRKSFSLNQENFGNDLGTNQVGITDIERGKKNVSIEILDILHTKFFINLNWLICGTGDIKHNYSDFDRTTESKLIYETQYKMLIESQQQTIDSQKQTIDAQKGTLEAQNRIIRELESKMRIYENNVINKGLTNEG
jgi:transcriptional regulator with XRE-family HTH domain